MRAINAPKIIKRILCAAGLSSFGALFVVAPAWAAAQVELGLSYGTALGLGTTDIRTTISRIISYFLGLLGLVAVSIILYAGFLWMTARGNEEQVMKAKKTMTNGVIGLIIILLAFIIVQFIFRALIGDEGAGGGPGGGPGGGGLGGGGRAFMVTSTMPAGPGPVRGGVTIGWPKNYPITVSFNHDVSDAPSSVSPTTFVVQRCNSRLDADGQPQAFKQSDCGAPITGTRTVKGGQAKFVPDSTPINDPEKDKPTYFEGEYWYYVELKGGVSGSEPEAVRDTSDPSRVLRCVWPPPIGVNIWDMKSSASSLCRRAIAFSNAIDETPPDLKMTSPASPPPWCGSTLPIYAQSDDDFVTARVDFTLDEKDGAPITGAIKPDAFFDNASDIADQPFDNPMIINQYQNPMSVDATKLTPGKSYVLKGIAQDPVPQLSSPEVMSFKLNLPQCCAGECGPTSPCGRCSKDDCKPDDLVCIENSQCSEGDQCASGICEGICECPTVPGACVPDKDCGSSSECTPGTCNGYCVSYPIIDSVTPGIHKAGDPPKRITGVGPGSPVSIKGRYFGKKPGKVIFLGNVNDKTDDKEGIPCAPTDWWFEDEPGVWVAAIIVPDGAEDGPIQIVTASGLIDDTTDAPPPKRSINLGVQADPYVVKGQPLTPGVCFASPNRGPKDTVFKIVGVGFGPTMVEQSLVNIGANEANVQPGGWSEKNINAQIPPIKEGVYNIAVTIGPPTDQTTTNDVKFTVTAQAGEEIPRITEIVPSSGPVDSYLTIYGSGFGSQKGVVRFVSKVIPPPPGKPDEAQGAEPACSDFWHKTYIVIKVPKTYLDQTTGVIPDTYNVIVRAQNGKESNAVDFTIDTSPLKPGVCALDKPSGPAAMRLSVFGENFGSGPGTKRTGSSPDYVWGMPHNTVNFYPNKNNAGEDQAFRPLDYSYWDGKTVTTVVPGEKGDKEKKTWPQSGPIYVEASNLWSSNSIPFKVQDCNEAGGDAACTEFDGTVCCPNGACMPSADCGPKPRLSGYGWIFSTEVMPQLPIVEQCLFCGLEACPNTFGFQSPSPQGQDACINAELNLNFNQNMNGNTYILRDATPANNTVIIEECSDAKLTSCQVKSDNFDMNRPDAKSVRFTPRDTYNTAHGRGHLSAGKWYRITLKSPKDKEATAANDGIKDLTPPNGRYLDGDYDRMPGGDFVYSFKVRDDASDCDISTVGVAPGSYNVDHQRGAKSPVLPPPPQNPSGFKVSPMGANCNILTCKNNDYQIAWDLTNNGTNPNEILNQYATSDNCWRQVDANRESVPPAFVGLQAHVTPWPPAPPAPPKATITGESQVTVKFADPKVVNYAPNCRAACVDASIFAEFNVSMNESTIKPGTGNFMVYECRNESCNRPFASTVSTGALEEIGSESKKYVASVTGLLKPGTFYRVELKGGDTGMKSTSGVSLKGLNEPGGFFVWKFRTKNDGLPCAVNRSAVQPPTALLQYIGERAPFEVTAFGAPDECSPTGQQLNAWRHSWLWDVINNPPTEPRTGVVRGFLPTPLDPLSRLNKKAASVVGCDGRCLNNGSQNVLPQCGNGVEEGQWEECDDAAGFTAGWCDPNTCLLTGTAAPSCGNGDPNPGEACDKDKASGLWPPGCKQPVGETNGCIFAGSEVGGASCGDGYIGDGEACDDGNVANGDGCSSICLLEGTLRSCLDTGAKCSSDPKIDCDPNDPTKIEDVCGAGASCLRETCVNFCGNNREEPGEDAGCDVASGPNAGVAIKNAGCDPLTCLKVGTDACDPADTEPENCCGNEIIEDGEECDKLAAWCGDRCLLNGASYLYDEPSFCNDGVAPDVVEEDGLGKDARCEDAAIPADNKIDPYQVIEAGLPASQSIVNGRSTDLIKAGVASITDPAKVGRAAVQMSCICDKQSNPQDFCYQLGQAGSVKVDLGCDVNGCCAPPPKIVEPVYPVMGAENICRNTVFRATFDQDLKKESAADGVLLYEQATTCNGLCSNNRTKICFEATKAADCGDPAATCDAIKFCANKKNTVCQENADCGTGPEAQCVARSPQKVSATGGAMALGNEKPSFWRRVVEFFRDIFFPSASAVTPPNPDNNTYCQVPGTVSLSGTTVTFFTKLSLKPTLLHRALILGANAPKGAILSKNGVPMRTTYNTYFKTGAFICKIDTVTVNPRSHLFTMAEDLGTGNDLDKTDGDHEFTAMAHPSVGGTDAEIGSTPDYAFKWNWVLQPEDAANKITSPIILTPAYLNQTPMFSDNGFCEYAKACSGDKTKSCRTDGDCTGIGTCTNYYEHDSTSNVDCFIGVPSGSTKQCNNASCEVGEDQTSCPDDCAVTAGQSNASMVRVRPASYAAVFPRNGQAQVEVAADIFDREEGISRMPASADVTVMLCNMPWPIRRTCQNIKTQKLPWDKTMDTSTLTCSSGPNELLWYPFYDPSTNLAFFYCRDGAKAGADSTLLPQLNEEQIVKIVYPDLPGQDILKEYLFTYVDSVEDKGKAWYNDAIGLRIVKNPMHLSAMEWYGSKKFKGAPVPLEVNDYEALRDGSTVYVNAVAKSVAKSGTLTTSAYYTNVYTLTYTDGAAPQTVNIYDQITKNIDVNRNVKDSFYCVKSDGSQAKDAAGNPIACTFDRQCRVDGREEICANEDCSQMKDNDKYGTFYPERAAWLCKTDKLRMVRDMKRISDMVQSRQTIVDANTGSGYPRLEAGTFLRARTNTAWPSWSNVLGSEIKSQLPVDPINAFMECKSTGMTFDLNTCWNSADKVYQCPSDSYVYEYQSIGGTDFRLMADLETRSSSLCTSRSTMSACNVAGGPCTWSDPDLLAKCGQVSGKWVCLGGYNKGIPCDGGSDKKCGVCQIKVPGTNWVGKTCVELGSKEECQTRPDCVWPNPDDGSGCQFAAGGKIFITGINQLTTNCKAEIIGIGGVCGDGIVQRSPYIPDGSNNCLASGNPTSQTTCEVKVGCYWDSGLSKCVKGEQCEPVSQPDVATCTVSNICKKKPSLSCASDLECVSGPDNFGPCIVIPTGARPGTKARTCQGNCTWLGYGRCVAGYCGDGVKQQDEICDDGDKSIGGHNGEYGFCDTTCRQLAGRCGDGTKQPVESCDCGSMNGAYFKNGILATALVPSCTGNDNTASVPSCSWDCKTAGPRCGDGAINGPNEVCDGGKQEAKGYCSSTKDPCGENKDCPAVTPPATNTCTGYCPTPEQRNQRFCVTNDPTVAPNGACKWGEWKCTLPGNCGDGIVQTGEECDDGNDDNTDGCVIADFSQPADGKNECRQAICGDAYVSKTLNEQCDLGSKNGVPCQPAYGVDCNYCTPACKLGTISGGFCGDGKIQDASASPPGMEECEGMLGLDNWICVNNYVNIPSSIDNKQFGRRTGNSRCSETTCKRYCADANSTSCKHDPKVNYDNKSPLAWRCSLSYLACTTDVNCQPNGGKCIQQPSQADGVAPLYTTVQNLPRTPLTWSEGYCSDPLKTPCVLLCPPGSTCPACPTGSTCKDVTSGVMILGDSCDADADNDRVPKPYDCNDLNPEVHPSYTQAGASVAAAGEKCNDIDDDCNGLVDDSPPVDMVFAIDVSGSMLGYIKALAQGISAFVNEFANSPHRFGYVLYSQGGGALVYDPYGTTTGRYCSGAKCFDTKVVPTDVTTMQTKLQELGDNFVTVGGQEPDWAVAYALAGSNGGGYGIPWRSTAKPFVVLMSDEKVSDGYNDTSYISPSTTPITEANVASRINTCSIGLCAGKAGEKVNFFIFTGSSYYADWDSIISSQDQSYRFIPISSNSSTVQNDLRTKVFAEVCVAH